MQRTPEPTDDEDNPDVTDPEEPDIPTADFPHYTDDLPF